MSTRSGKRIHSSPQDNNNGERKSSRNGIKTRSKRQTKDSADGELTERKRKKHYVKYPSEEILEESESNGKSEQTVRKSRRNTLKERNANDTSAEEPDLTQALKTSRRTRRCEEPGDDTTLHAARDEHEKKDKKKSKKKKMALVVNENKLHIEQSEKVAPSKKKSNKKKNKKKSNSIVVEDVAEHPKALNSSGASVDSFHSAAGSPTPKNENSEELNISGKKSKSTKHSTEIGLSPGVSNSRTKDKLINSGNHNMSLEFNGHASSDDQAETRRLRKRKSSTSIGHKTVENNETTEDPAAKQLKNTRRKKRKLAKSSFDKDNLISNSCEENLKYSKNNFKWEDTACMTNDNENKANTTYDKEDTFDDKNNVKSKLFKNDESNNTFNNDDRTNMTLDEEKDATTTFAKEDKLNGTFDKKDKLNSTFERKSNANSTFDKNDQIRRSTFSKEDRTSNTFEKVKDSNATFDKEDIPNATFDKVGKTNTTFDKEDIANTTFNKEDKTNTTFDKKQSINTTFENNSRGNSTLNIEERINTTFNKEDIANTTFNKEDKTNTTFDKKQSVNATFENNNRGNSTLNIEERVNTTFDKKQSINTTFEKKIKGNSTNTTFDKEDTTNTADKKAKTKSTSDKNYKGNSTNNIEERVDTTFDKEDIANTTFNKKEKTNTTFDMKEKTNTTFDMEDNTNATLLKNDKYNKKENISNTTFNKDETSSTVDNKDITNSTFERQDTFVKLVNTLESARKCNNNKKIIDKTAKVASEMSPKLSAKKRSSIRIEKTNDVVNKSLENISNDSSNDSILTSDTSKSSHISVTSDESQTSENILNNTPLLVESSMEEENISKCSSSNLTNDENTTAVALTPLKREGTFTKESPEVTVASKSKTSTVKTLTRRKSLPSPGCTPFPNSKSLSKDKSILNITRSIEKSRRSSVAEMVPRATKVMFCSPSNNPVVVSQMKGKIIKSSLKGSNKSFVFEDNNSPQPRVAGRKRSQTADRAAGAEPHAKRSRLAEPAPAAAASPRPPRLRTRTLSASAKLPEVAAAGSPARERVRTRLPNFAALHARQFARMESLDECQRRRAERARLLLTPTGPASDRTSPKDSQAPKQAEPAPKKTETPTKGKPAAAAAAGYSRFGFKLQADGGNPFSFTASKATGARPEARAAAGAALKRQATMPSLAGATRKQLARQAVMREKSFAGKRDGDRQESRTVIKGVRTNRRFELQMKMRNINA